jgi:hypothetical protein
VTSPPQQPDPADAIGAADRLAGALNGLSVRLDAVKKDSEDRDAALKRYGRHNRLGLLFDIVITALLALGGFAISNASHRADTATATAASASASEQALHAAQVTGCESGNQYRTGVVASLDRLVSILEGSHPTPAVQKAATGYERYVLSQNEPRDCAKAYPLPSAKGGGSG